MIVALHALIGAALGRFTRTRTQAALLGGVSHIAADMLPHRDLDIPQEAALLAGTLTFIAAARGTGSREFAGALGAAAPDIENLIGRIRGLPDDKLLLPSHRSYHGPKTDGFHGQLALALIGLALLLLPDNLGDGGAHPPA
jgi:hypothetical protein